MATLNDHLEDFPDFTNCTPADRERAVQAAVSTLESWLPGGTWKSNGEYRCRIRPNDKNPSCDISPDTGAYHDFGNGESGSILDLFARFNGLSDWSESVRVLNNGHSPEPRPRKKQKSSYWDAFELVADLPDDLPALDPWYIEQWGNPVAHWDFDRGGQFVFRVYRFVEPDGGKSDRPFTLWKKGDLIRWRSKEPATRLPLWNQDALADRPDDTVVIFEGQKDAANAAGMLPEYVCVGWYGGVNAVNRQDWKPVSGRDVVFWPDPDDAGQSVIPTVVESLQNNGAATVRVVELPAGIALKYDIGEAVADGSAIGLIESAVDPADMVITPVQTTPEADGGSRFKFTPVGDMVLRAPDSIIPGYIERRTIAELFADPNTGKTLLAHWWAACVSSGTPWDGIEIKNPGPVFIVNAEGGSGIPRRFAAISQVHDVPTAGLPVLVSSGPMLIDDPESVRIVEDAITAAADEYGAPVMVMIDTYSQNMAGDENSTSDTGAAIAGAARLRDKFNACVLIIHHTGHGDKTRSRGAIAKRAALDHEFRLDKDESGVLRLHCTKQRDAAFPAPRAYQIKPVRVGTDDNGEPIFSATLESVAYTDPAKRGKTGRGKNQTKALQVLRDETKRHEDNLESFGGNPLDARVSIDTWKGACLDAGIPRNRFKEISDALLNAGIISIESGGYVYEA